MKYNKNFERDYNFYLINIDNFKFSGKNLKDNLIYSETGKSAKETFYIFDSNGKIKPCFEIDILEKILNCKASINLHIKMWAEGWAECTLHEDEILEIINDYNCPEWVYKAIIVQKDKIIKNWIKNNQNEELVILHKYKAYDKEL